MAVSMQDICIELYTEFDSPRAQVWHVLTRHCTVLPDTHTFIHDWNEPSRLYFPAAVHHHTLAGTHFLSNCMVEGEGLVLWMGGPPDASFGFYLREAFPSQTNKDKILYNKSC